MLNSFKIPQQQVGETPETQKDDSEEALVPQILGNEEAAIRQSVAKLQEWGARGIDINMGCPVQKALKHNYGVALMGDAKYAAEVVGMAARASSLPVSVKLRAGQEEKDLGFLKDFVQGLEGSGASWLCLHPRMGVEKRRGVARWEQISFVREHVKCPVIGNGDVQTVDDVLQMLSQTQCDMVMVGRALLARPWLMWQLGEKLGFAPPPGREGESAPQTPEEEGREFGRVVQSLTTEMFRVFKPELAMRKFRFYLRHSAVWLEFGHELERVAANAQDEESLRVSLADFFNYSHRLCSRTQLRQ